MTDSSANLGQQVHQLLEAQKNEWPALRDGYAALADVQTRSLEFDDFTFRLQFNPRRIVSSGAKVDAKSIAERKCFLCPANLPAEQRGIEFAGEYLILGNPFPIFPEHFTIPIRSHTPQRIGASFGAMLDLARALANRYTIFYNGPKCGASAPDHLHFQAGDTGFMPIDREYDAVKESRGTLISESSNLRVFAIDRYQREIISFESADREALLRGVEKFRAIFATMQPNEDEPMMNILASHDGREWRVIVFPRVKHRPGFFFAEGDAKILLSPASVDFGGVCITPVEKDFHRVTKDLLIEMFNEVCLGNAQFGELARGISLALAR